MLPNPVQLERGSPYPLGATWDGLGINFAVFSAHAERIELCLFDPGGRREIARLDLPECTDEVWHGYLPNAGTGLIYGYRAYGPYRPQEGHRFNPYKLLLDPYARRLIGKLRWTDALFGYRIDSPRSDLSFDRRDSAPSMPKAIVSDDVFDWGDDRPPNIPWSRTVIYEAHLRGMTMLRDDIRPNERGTFAALVNPNVIKYLQSLGITAVELLPIHAFVQDRHLIAHGLKNYWGYNSLGFFSIEPAYLSNGSRNEMRVAVRRLHAAGIEVILDVVYNHTAEGSELGPTLSFRGLDNASYYRLVQDNRRHCVNDTGTGNTMNLSHPRVLQMVMDSLRYWVTSFHVDGFRFDLGVTLGREAHGFDPGSGFFDALRQDPVLTRVKLISEPWDLGPGGYQLGHHPPGFAEWNDRFRDSSRYARRPWASINYVASHDGFTLADVVSFAQRHNETNGEANNDGAVENYSANWGIEGAISDEKINRIRARVRRAMLATVMFAHGTPMLLAGDEFGRSQSGNNNAYCQDNETSWMDWAMVDSAAGREMRDFVSKLIAVRQEHRALRSRHFLHGYHEPASGIFDIAWFNEDGENISEASWKNPEHRLLCLRRATRNADATVSLLTLLLNPTAGQRLFQLPQPALPSRVLIDTAQPKAEEYDLKDSRTEVDSYSAVLLYAKLEPGSQ
jgi:isoamylase